MVLELGENGYGKRDNHETRQDVEEGGAVSEVRKVDAVTADFWFPDFANWRALENANEECRYVDANEENDCAPSGNSCAVN